LLKSIEDHADGHERMATVYSFPQNDQEYDMVPVAMLSWPLAAYFTEYAKVQPCGSGASKWKPKYPKALQAAALHELQNKFSADEAVLETIINVRTWSKRQSLCVSFLEQLSTAEQLVKRGYGASTSAGDKKPAIRVESKRGRRTGPTGRKGPARLSSTHTCSSSALAPKHKPLETPVCMSPATATPSEREIPVPDPRPSGGTPSAASCIVPAASNNPEPPAPKLPQPRTTTSAIAVNVSPSTSSPRSLPSPTSRDARTLPSRVTSSVEGPSAKSETAPTGPDKAPRSRVGKRRRDELRNQEAPVEVQDDLPAAHLCVEKPNMDMLDPNAPTTIERSGPVAPGQDDEWGCAAAPTAAEEELKEEDEVDVHKAPVDAREADPGAYPTSPLLQGAGPNGAALGERSWPVVAGLGCEESTKEPRHEGKADEDDEDCGFDNTQPPSHTPGGVGRGEAVAGVAMPAKTEARQGIEQSRGKKEEDKDLPWRERKPSGSEKRPRNVSLGAPPELDDAESSRVKRKTHHRSELLPRLPFSSPVRDLYEQQHLDSSLQDAKTCSSAPNPISRPITIPKKPRHKGLGLNSLDSSTAPSAYPLKPPARTASRQGGGGVGTTAPLGRDTRRPQGSAVLHSAARLKAPPDAPGSSETSEALNSLRDRRRLSALDTWPERYRHSSSLDWLDDEDEEEDEGDPWDVPKSRDVDLKPVAGPEEDDFVPLPPPVVGPPGRSILISGPSYVPPQLVRHKGVTFGDDASAPPKTAQAPAAVAMTGKVSIAGRKFFNERTGLTPVGRRSPPPQQHVDAVGMSVRSPSMPAPPPPPPLSPESHTGNLSDPSSTPPPAAFAPVPELLRPFSSPSPMSPEPEDASSDESEDGDPFSVSLQPIARSPTAAGSAALDGGAPVQPLLSTQASSLPRVKDSTTTELQASGTPLVPTMTVEEPATPMSSGIAVPRLSCPDPPRDDGVGESAREAPDRSRTGLDYPTTRKRARNWDVDPDSAQRGPRAQNEEHYGEPQMRRGYGSGSRHTRERSSPCRRRERSTSRARSRERSPPHARSRERSPPRHRRKRSPPRERSRERAPTERYGSHLPQHPALFVKIPPELDSDFSVEALARAIGSVLVSQDRERMAFALFQRFGFVDVSTLAAAARVLRESATRGIFLGEHRLIIKSATRPFSCPPGGAIKVDMAWFAKLGPRELRRSGGESASLAVPVPSKSSKAGLCSNKSTEASSSLGEASQAATAPPQDQSSGMGVPPSLGAASQAAAALQDPSSGTGVPPSLGAASNAGLWDQSSGMGVPPSLGAASQAAAALQDPSSGTGVPPSLGAAAQAATAPPQDQGFIIRHSLGADSQAAAAPLHQGSSTEASPISVAMAVEASLRSFRIKPAANSVVPQSDKEKRRADTSIVVTVPASSTVWGSPSAEEDLRKAFAPFTSSKQASSIEVAVCAPKVGATQYAYVNLQSKGAVRRAITSSKSEAGIQVRQEKMSVLTYHESTRKLLRDTEKQIATLRKDIASMLAQFASRTRSSAPQDKGGLHTADDKHGPLG